MIPGEYNITLYRGKTIEIPIYYADDSGPVDLHLVYTGARMQVRPAPINVPTLPPPVEPALYELTTTNGKLVFEDGGLFIKLTAAESAVLPFTSAKYDIELYSGTGVSEVVDPFLEGSIKVKGEVTCQASV